MSVNLADLQSELRSSVKELNPDVLCGSTELQPSWVPASVTIRVLHIHGNDASSLSLATYRDGLSQRVCSWTLPNGRPQACSSPSMFLLTTNSTHDQHEPEQHDHPAGHELGAGRRRRNVAAWTASSQTTQTVPLPGCLPDQGGTPDRGHQPGAA